MIIIGLIGNIVLNIVPKFNHIINQKKSSIKNFALLSQIGKDFFYCDQIKISPIGNLEIKKNKKVITYSFENSKIYRNNRVFYETQSDTLNLEFAFSNDIDTSFIFNLGDILSAPPENLSNYSKVIVSIENKNMMKNVMIFKLRNRLIQEDIYESNAKKY